ncbi:hypothetical protein MNEG_11296, partial [Monoraphidium neglectum]
MGTQRASASHVHYKAAPRAAYVRPKTVARRPQPVSVSVGATLSVAPPVAPHQATSASAQQQQQQQQLASLEALLTATGTDSVIAQPAQQRPLHRAERFEDTYAIGEVLGNGTY